MPLNPPIARWAGRSAWILGASTGIGRATASRLHAAGARVFVSARNAEALARFVVAHPGAVAVPLDATDREAVAAAARDVLAEAGTLDLALYCAGTYTPMRAAAFDLETALRHVDVNYTGALAWLDALLPALRAQAAAGHGAHLSLVGSVAGYRGLPQALAYGPTKAALINLAEILYMDLQPEGVGVSIVNPGFVETPLTAQNGFKMPALLTPDEAADAIVAGWRRGDFEIHFPKRFTLWLKALRHVGYRPYFAAVRRSTGL